MKLHVLGSGCPQPTREAYGSAFILELGGDSLMVDCGPGTTYKMGLMGIKTTQVGTVFLTHHHFDHNGDFPCFALTRWDQCTGGEPPLRVFGPEPTRVFVDRLLGPEGAFFPDWHSRVEHPASHACHTQRGGSLPRPAPTVAASDVGPGMVAEGDGWAATAARVHHVEPGLESLAYRFECDEGSILFAGDCGDCRELRELALGADTLVLACTHFGRGRMAHAIADVITGTTEVAGIATGAGSGRVVLTHVSPNFSLPGVKEGAVADVARHYGGSIVFPAELSTVDL